MRKLTDNNKGSVLITILWIMAILSLLAMGIGFRASLEVRLSRYNMDRLQARFLAKAGIVKARERLSKDDKMYDTLYECGITLAEGETPEKVFGAEYNKLGEDDFCVYYGIEKDEYDGSADIKYGMIDEERKLNIKLSSLKKFGEDYIYRSILERLFADVEGASEIAGSIIDWQDDDTVGEAEDAYYEGLEKPYKCKDADFEFVEELLLVKGMTPEIFDEIKDYVTVYGEGEININTASANALNAVIDDGSGTYTDTLVERIVNHRKDLDGKEGTSDDVGFADETELLAWVSEDVENAERKRLTELKYNFTYKSQNYRIVSHGSARKVRKTITAIVKKGTDAEEKNILYYHEEY